MKKSFVGLLLLTFVVGAAQNIIPIPNDVKLGNGKLSVDMIKSLRLSNDSLRNESAFLGEYFDFSADGGNTISLLIDKSIDNVQGYSLTVDNKGVTIKASTRQGIFYGIQTLIQLIDDNEIPFVEICDKPRLEYRALMLDPARHFLSAEDVKRYIDAIARYKYNYLHLHLSDDQGWRVEIKKYPRLTEVGSVRADTEGDGVPHRGYYTQEQLRDIVAFAAQRHIEIIPEIDIPGHSVAAIAAYAELTCRDTIIPVRSEIGVSLDLLCAGNEKVFEMYGDIFEEICEIFPSKLIHLGGDEAPLTHWGQCPKCQALKKEKGYTDDQELMSYFFGRINQTLLRHNRTALFWYEVDVPDYPRNAIMYTWRNGLTPRVIEECREKGYRVICAPGEFAYFDYPEVKSDITAKSSSWIPALPFEKVYQFDPCYGLSEEKSSHIIGVEATVWGEYVPDLETAFFRTFPRAFALAEAGWSKMSRREWNDFLLRTKRELEHLKSRKINFRQPQQ